MKDPSVMADNVSSAIASAIHPMSPMICSLSHIHLFPQLSTTLQKDDGASLFGGQGVWDDTLITPKASSLTMQNSPTSSFGTPIHDLVQQFGVLAYLGTRDRVYRSIMQPLWW
jgi:hypothetical protein